MLLNVYQAFFVIFISEMYSVRCRIFGQSAVTVYHSAVNIAVRNILLLCNTLDKLIEFTYIVVGCTVCFLVGLLLCYRRNRKEIDFCLGLILLCFFYQRFVLAYKCFRIWPADLILAEHHKDFFIDLC